MASTVTDDELQRLALDDLLHRLFNEETLRLFDAHGIKFSCSCSRQRTAAMLLSLGKAEASEILEAEGEISVSCEFCSANYSFDQIDVEQVFGEGAVVSTSATTH